MSSELQLKNSGGSTLAITHSDSKGGKTIIGTDIVTSVATINDFPAVGIQEGDTVIVKDADRGGTFILKYGGNIGLANDGTIFVAADPFYYWHRQYDGAVNVKWFGAVSDTTAVDTGTENRPYFQAAIDVGTSVYVPTGKYKLSSLIIDKQIKFYGDGINNTIIYPTDGNDTITVATDHVTLSDFEIRGGTSTQTQQSGTCILLDAVSNNPAFARHMEGIKIERIKILNISKNGIYCPHLIRESHIRECRFLGVGASSYGSHPMKFQNIRGSASNINNLFIDKNVFYRFETEAISMERSTLITASSAPSFATLYITNNLFHGQLIDTSDTEELVQPAACSHLIIEDVSGAVVRGNNLTSMHPQHYGVKVSNNGVACEEARIVDNAFATKSIVDGKVYNRIGPTVDDPLHILATGANIYIRGANAVSGIGNSIYGGIYSKDIILDKGDYTTPIYAMIRSNTSVAGAILVDYTGLDVWKGHIEEYENFTSKETLTILDKPINATNADGISTISRNGNEFALQLKYDDTTAGALLGSPAANQLEVSTSGGSGIAQFLVTTLRPSVDNGRSLGTAGLRWSEVFSANATINTSDERLKTPLEIITEKENKAAIAIKASIGRFKFLDAVDEKGINARVHFGVGAQTVKTIMEDNGLVAENYSFFCYDEWKSELGSNGEVQVNAGNRYGIRYEELIMFILGAI